MNTAGPCSSDGMVLVSRNVSVTFLSPIWASGLSQWSHFIVDQSENPLLVTTTETCGMSSKYSMPHFTQVSLSTRMAAPAWSYNTVGVTVNDTSSAISWSAAISATNADALKRWSVFAQS